MQNGAGVQIGTEGDMTFFGQAFSADFERIIMNGEVNYEVPGGAPAPKLKLRPPLEPLAIEDLVDPREPIEKRVEQETVALVPVRYAIDQRTEGEPLYAYSAPQLAKDLPELQQAQYVLRRARTGWLYLLLNGKLYAFEIDDNASLIPEPESKAALEAAQVKTENQALLLPKAAGSVWLAYSEHPWTDKQRSAMEAGAKRHQQMQRFELAAPGKDAFELKAIADQVVDYGGPGGDFAWSDTPGSLAYDLNGLQAELLNAAEAGQQVVALHDPIGIGRDLSNLLCHDILERETRKAQRPHKTASAITALNLIDAAKPTQEKIAARSQTLYDEAMGRSGGPVGLIKQPSDFEPQARAQLQAEQDKLIARLRTQPDELRRHLDKERQALKPLTRRIEIRGADACHWLRECPGQLVEHHLDTYDLTDIPTALAYEDAVTGCQGGLCETRDGLDLLSEWLQRNPSDSPYWKAIAGDDADLLNELSGVSGSAETTKSVLKELKAAKKLWSAISDARKAGEALTSLHANSNTEQLSLAASAVVSARYKQAGSLDAELEQLVQRLRVIALGRMGLLFKDRYVGLREIEAALWRNFHAERQGGNGLRLTPLSQAMRDATQQRVSTSALTTTHQGQVRVWVVAHASGAEQPPRKGEVALLRKPASELLPKEPSIADAFNLEKIRTYGYVGVTGGLAFFSTVNLISVMSEYINDNSGENPDLDKRFFSALTAFGSAVLSFGDAYMEARHLYLGKPTTGITATYKAPIVLGRISAQMAVKFGATTLGAVVSFYEASMAGDRAGKLQKSKDPDAARAYFHQRTAHLWAGGLGIGYASATFASGALGAGAEAGALALGASAVLAGAAVVLLVASFIAIGVAVYYGVQGEKLTDGPVDVWLDRCWWGKQEGLKQLKPYSNLDEEIQGYFELSYTPQIVADWSDRLSSFNLDNLDITLYLPGYKPGKSAFYLMDQINLPMPATLTARPLPEPEPVDKLAGVYCLKLPTLKVKDGSAVSMVFRYFPDEVELPDQMIQLTRTFKDD